VIYFVQPVDGGPVKIGYSADPQRRHAQLEAIYRRPLVALAVIEGDRRREREIHDRFAHLRLGNTEQFRPAPELAEFIGAPLIVSPNPDTIEAMPSRQQKIIMTLRGSDEFETWVKGLADFDATSVAEMTERAYAAYARQIGYAEARPRR
jgi:hypothetical protein